MLLLLLGLEINYSRYCHVLWNSFAIKRNIYVVVIDINKVLA